MTKRTSKEVLFLAYIAMLAVAVTLQAIPPLMGFLVPVLDISHGQAGALMSFYAFPGILMSIPGGFLTDIYGPKQVGTAALGIIVMGTLLVGLGNTFLLLLIGRVVAGIGGAVVGLAAPQTISHWFSEQDVGSAMGIFHTAMPLGTVLALNLFGRFAGFWGWRMPILLTAAYALIVLVLFMLRHPGLPKQGHTGESKQPKMKEIAENIRHAGWPVWQTAAVWMMFNASALAFVTFAGDYYTSIGYDVGYAGFLASLFMLGSLLFSPITGRLIDRTGKEQVYMISGCALLALVMLLVPLTNLNPLLLGGLVGLAGGMVPAPVFAMIPKLLPEAQAGIGYGILSTLANIGMLMGPLVIGFSYDRMQNYIIGFYLMAAFAATAVVVAIFLKTPTPHLIKKEGKHH